MSKHEIGDLLAHVRRPGKVPKSEYLEDGEFPVIDQGKLSVAGYTNNSEVVLHSPLPVVVFGDHTRAVKFAKVPFACGADGTQLLYPNTDKIDPTFFFYAVKNINLSNYFYARHFKFLKKQTIELPPRQSQIYIASILSTYDDLIENNQRRIQLLEQSARLLYKEWFVHLRFPGHEHTTITDGVPEGWESRQVKDVLESVKRPRKIMKAEFLADGPIPCVDQSRDFIGGYTDDEESVVDIGKPVIVFGDHTRILKFVDFPFASGADGTQLIVSNDDAISQEFLYFALDSIDLSNYFYARHFKFLKDQYIPIPTNALVTQFTGNIRPILEQIKALREYCHHLAKARDLLLPRLMNERIVVT